MSKWIKKKETIEAFKWADGMEEKDYPIWMVEALQRPWAQNGAKISQTRKGVAMAVNMGNKRAYANVNDYIAQDGRGGIFTIGAELFEATYEKPRKRVRK